MGSISDCMSGRSYAYRNKNSTEYVFTAMKKLKLKEFRFDSNRMVETDMGGHMPHFQSKIVQNIQRIEEQTLKMTGRYVQFDGTPIEW